MTRPDIAQARIFAALIADFEPRIRRAFMASVTDLQSNVNWPLLLDQLAAGNVEGAIAALNIHPSAWAAYSAEMTAAYAAAGASTIAQIKRAGVDLVGVRFNLANPRAEAWIAENVADKVVGFANEQVKSARTLIETGYSKGAHPHMIALDLAGRASGGSRAGGILGLDGPRAHRYSMVSEGIRTAEGVQALVVERLDGSLGLRYKVNRASENRILAAYRAGTAVPDADVIRRQFGNALLKARADTIAATETGNAVMSARAEEWAQLAESKGLKGVIKTWQHRRGASKYHRPDHLAMSGVEVFGLDTPFEFPDGTRMQYAHDPSAGPEHLINCGCDTEYRLSVSGHLKVAA